jgi:hypothetical protein
MSPSSNVTKVHNPSVRATHIDIQRARCDIAAYFPKRPLLSWCSRKRHNHLSNISPLVARQRRILVKVFVILLEEKMKLKSIITRDSSKVGTAAEELTKVVCSTVETNIIIIAK